MKTEYLLEDEREMLRRADESQGSQERTGSYLYALLSRLAELRERERWIPFSTPPKLGQKILLCCGALGCVPRVAEWTAKGWRWTDSESPYDINGPATGWRPLPDPPKEEV